MIPIKKKKIKKNKVIKVVVQINKSLLLFFFPLQPELPPLVMNMVKGVATGEVCMSSATIVTYKCYNNMDGFYKTK